MALIIVPADVGRLIVVSVDDADVVRLQRTCKKLKHYSDSRMEQLRSSIPNNREVLRWIQRQYERYESVNVLWYRPASTGLLGGPYKDVVGGEAVHVDTPLLVVREHTRRMTSNLSGDFVSLYYLSDTGRMTTRTTHRIIRYDMELIIPLNSIVDPMTLLRVMRERRCVCKYEVDSMVSSTMTLLVSRIETMINTGVVGTREHVADTYRRMRDELQMAISWVGGMSTSEIAAYEDTEDADPDADHDNVDVQMTETELLEQVIGLVVSWKSGKIRYALPIVQPDVLPCDEEICRWLEYRLSRIPTRVGLLVGHMSARAAKVIVLEIDMGLIVYRCYDMKLSQNEVDWTLCTTDVPEECLVETILRERRIKAMVDPVTLLEVMRGRDDRYKTDIHTHGVVRIKWYLMTLLEPILMWFTGCALFNERDTPRIIPRVGNLCSTANNTYARWLCLLVWFWMGRSSAWQRSRAEQWLSAGSNVEYREELIRSMLHEARAVFDNCNLTLISY